MKAILILIFMTIGLSSFANALMIDEPWTGVSEPGIMSTNLVHEFDLLPRRGTANGREKFWSGDYWSKKKGSINVRWNSQNQSGYGRWSPTREQARTMSLANLARLAPSEKYDLLTGRYHYPLKTAVEENSDPGAAFWEGICHGWAPATMNHNEPTPKVLVNPDGIRIPFGSSDIKALLSYFYAFENKVDNTHQMGRRCSSRNRGNSVDCNQDLNAGAFHIVLANKIGLEGVGFIADFERFEQVWNHPIHQYETRVLAVKRRNRSSAPGTVRVLRVETKVVYIDESENTWETLLGTSLQQRLVKNFLYDLDMNAYGEIIGGEWISKDRPDFIWTTQKAKVFTGEFDQLARLLND